MKSEQLLDFLFELKLINTEDVVNCNFQIKKTNGRNINLEIIRTKSPSYFIKQADISNRDLSKSFQNELLWYSRIKKEKKLHPLLKLLPNMVFSDFKKNIIILENLRKYKNFHSVCSPSSSFPVEPFFHLGKALAILHNNLSKTSLIKSKQKINSSFLKNFAYPIPSSFAYLRQVDIEIYKIIQKFPKLLSFFEKCALEWDPASFIHGDIRWANILYASKKEEKIKFLDLEMIEYGDPAWDIGCVFQEIVVSWFLSFKIKTGRESPEQLGNTSKFSINDIQLAVRSFWFSYINNLKINYEQEKLLQKSIHFFIAKLALSSREYAIMSTKVQNISYLIIQTSANLAQNSQNARLLLFGQT